ncbi:metallophosphoesterase family protein [Cohnella nanjingensis]|uniref:Phosphoesterase n=1 Tax=Cohnella nanjingensis TaxID=1387779 RepID=A0A7X0RS90_9BACL|nr:metallophosphoesterase [Cohnella nanjingensis]MBB6672747.1 metallophosphoesterase [Cohnella nanjingensis]
MKLVVVADTHMPRMAKTLPPRLVAELRTADAILHAGDWTDPGVADLFSAYAPLEGVAGNNDGPKIAQRFGYRKVLHYGSRRIGLVHGHGDGGRGHTETRAMEAFQDTQVDGIVFGHSHIPLLKTKNGILLFNPGSPTDKRRQPRYSFGILTLGPEGLRARHVFYDAKS